MDSTLSQCARQIEKVDALRSLHKIAVAGILAVPTIGCGALLPRPESFPEQRSILDGNYEGTVTLTNGPGPAVREGPVRFSFDTGKYHVQGAKDLAPPGCGVFEFWQKVRLKDECAHTADFDWTLILKGDFDYHYDGSTLTLEQYDAKHDRHRRIVLHRIVDASRSQ